MPSKKGYILVKGFIELTVNAISFDLMKLANPTDTTLLPKLVSWTPPGISAVLIPVLVLSTLSDWDTEVVLFLNKVLPDHHVLDELVILPVSVLTPVQVSFQLFQTVPRFKSNTPWEARFVNVSYTFGRSTLNSGCVSVAIHSSLSGVNIRFPMKSIVSYGFKLTVVLAKLWVTYAVSVYGKVINSPVFWYPFVVLIASVIAVEFSNAESDSIRLILFWWNAGLNSPFATSIEFL